LAYFFVVNVLLTKFKYMFRNCVLNFILFISIHFTYGQNGLVINLENNNHEVVNFINTKGYPIKAFYDISEEKYSTLEKDAIKISGSDLSIQKLKNYFLVSYYNQEL